MSHFRGFTLRLGSEDRQYLDALTAQLGYSAAADGMRHALRGFRTLFELPAYMSERLRADMEAQRLGVFAYLRELLARRFQELNALDGPTLSPPALMPRPPLVSKPTVVKPFKQEKP